MSRDYTTRMHQAVKDLEEVLRKNEWALERVDEDEVAARFEWRSGFQGEVGSRTNVLIVDMLGNIDLWEVREHLSTRMSGTFRFNADELAALAKCSAVIRAEYDKQRKVRHI